MGRQSRLNLVVRGPRYFSQGDEKAFFDWLYSVSCVAKIGGRLRDLYVTLKRAPNDADLRELIALLFRYRMNMKPLAVFLTSRNAKWFAANPDAFWHAKIFGKGVREKSN